MSPPQPPSHWRSQPLKRLATEFISGGTPSTGRADFWDGDVPWTTSAPIADDDVVLSRAQRFITDAGIQGSASHLVPRGSLLVGTRVGVGKAVVNEVDIAISQDLTGVVIDSRQAETQFLAYQFKVERVRGFFDARSRGTTIKGVSRFDLERLDLWLPPLPEQRAIARALRAVQEAKEARQRELALERERKATLMEFLFAHGTRGEPGRQTESGEIPESWEEVRLGRLVADGPQNGLYKPAEAYGEGTPIIRINDFDNDGTLSSGQLNRVRLSNQEVGRYRVNGGDILLNRVNSLSHLGKSVLVPRLAEPTVFESNMMRFHVDESVALPEYVACYLVTERCKARMRGMAKLAVAQCSINQADVQSLLLPLPPVSEQGEVTSVLRACDKKIEALNKESDMLDELFHAMLEELMTGRLCAVPLIE